MLAVTTARRTPTTLPSLLAPESTPVPDTFETRRLRSYLDSLRLPAGPTRLVAGSLLTPTEVRLRYAFAVLNVAKRAKQEMKPELTVADVAQAIRLDSRATTVAFSDIVDAGLAERTQSGILATR